MFIHDALDELITCGDTDITVQALKSKIDQMHKIIPGKGVSGFDSQFQVRGCLLVLNHNCLFFFFFFFFS